MSRVYANFIVDCKIFSGDDTFEHGQNVNALLGFKGSVIISILLIAKHHGTRVCWFKDVFDRYHFHEFISRHWPAG